MCNEISTGPSTLEIISKTVIQSYLNDIPKDYTTNKDKLLQAYKFAEFICNQINSFTHHLSRNTGRKRFSPHIVRAAIALWSKAGSRAYEEFQSSTYNCFPLIRHYKK